MQREWKTWSQIAVMIVQQIRNFPYGRNLLWLEFRDVDDEKCIGNFVFDADNSSDTENAIIAERVVAILKILREKYKISSTTIH